MFWLLWHFGHIFCKKVQILCICRRCHRLARFVRFPVDYSPMVLRAPYMFSINVSLQHCIHALYTGIAYRHCCDKIEIIKKIRKISFFIRYLEWAKNRAILELNFLAGRKIGRFWRFSGRFWQKASGHTALQQHSTSWADKRRRNEPILNTF